MREDYYIVNDNGELVKTHASYNFKTEKEAWVDYKNRLTLKKLNLIKGIVKSKADLEELNEKLYKLESFLYELFKNKINFS